MEIDEIEKKIDFMIKMLGAINLRLDKLVNQETASKIVETLKTEDGETEKVVRGSTPRMETIKKASINSNPSEVIMDLKEVTIIAQTEKAMLVTKKGFQKGSMKIVTCNIPKIYLKYIKEICDGDDAEEHLGFEPSRSEFVRHAIKDKIMRDIRLSLFFKGEKREWLINERMTHLEHNLKIIKVPYTSRRREPLGNAYYNKGLNEE